MIKLRSKRFRRSSSKVISSVSNKGGDSTGNVRGDGAAVSAGGEIKWELRPGGMLVQKRDDSGEDEEGMITVRVSSVKQWHLLIPIKPTSTFGDLKILLSLTTALEAKEQRLLYKGKEREDWECLHMVGVGDGDKVLLLEDPAMKDGETSGLAAAAAMPMGTSRPTIRV